MGSVTRMLVINRGSLRVHAVSAGGVRRSIDDANGTDMPGGGLMAAEIAVHAKAVG
jgi:hypothetical protein